MENTTSLIWGLIFGSIGIGFFIYGKKQKVLVPFLVGIALFALPYIFIDTTMLVVAGLILVVTPYFVKL